MECKASVADLGNYEEVKQEIANQLAALRDAPQRCASPPSSQIFPHVVLQSSDHTLRHYLACIHG